jgi:hypothetical protein
MPFYLKLPLMPCSPTEHATRTNASLLRWNKRERRWSSPRKRVAKPNVTWIRSFIKSATGLRISLRNSSNSEPLLPVMTRRRETFSPLSTSSLQLYGSIEDTPYDKNPFQKNPKAGPMLFCGKKRGSRGEAEPWCSVAGSGVIRHATLPAKRPLLV